MVASDKLLPSVGEVFRILMTFLIVVIGWVIFRAESIGQAWDYLCGMWQWDTLRAGYRLITQRNLISRTGVVLVMVLIEWLNRKTEHGLDLRAVKSPLLRYGIYIFVILVLMISVESSPSQFIYFQF